ncbi:hypothetical protein DYE48_03445 [Halobacillus trueperi]|uniref:Uncharacterized protein n=1 Tax=Halobacillus trueperi TaxID=156205 RepID=A0A3E0JC75_9BACI|nr:hypothetical protein DYE48_03445 [Halobacillus trueperi]
MFPGFVAWLSIGAAGKLLAFLWGSAELPRTASCGISPISFLPRESHSFPTTPFDVGEKRTPLPSWIVFHYLTVRSIKCSASSFYVLWSGLYDPLSLMVKADFLEVVSRIFHGKGAEGNGETPAGNECSVRPRKALA